MKKFDYEVFINTDSAKERLNDSKELQTVTNAVTNPNSSLAEGSKDLLDLKLPAGQEKRRSRDPAKDQRLDTDNTLQ